LSAIALLCEIIAQGGKVSTATYGQHPEFKTLLRGGYVRESGVVRAVECLECDETHDAEIIFDAGRYGYACPEIGFVPVDRAEITAWQSDLSAIVTGIADAFACKRRRSAPVQGETWRIGKVASHGGDVSIYLHPALNGEREALDLMAALSREVRTPFRLILTSSGRLPIPDTKVVPLVDVVKLNLDLVGFAVLADPCDVVGAPRDRTGGAPNRYRDIVTPLIQSRTEEGTALEGRNEEAKAIQAILKARDSGANLPSLSSIKVYVTKSRAGQ